MEHLQKTSSNFDKIENELQNIFCFCGVKCVQSYSYVYNLSQCVIWMSFFLLVFIKKSMCNVATNILDQTDNCVDQ